MGDTVKPCWPLPSAPSKCQSRSRRQWRFVIALSVMMPSMVSHLASLTTIEAAPLLANPRCVGLLPVGAIEAHGPHLPLDTDVCLSLELCNRIAQILDRER